MNDTDCFELSTGAIWLDSSVNATALHALAQQCHNVKSDAFVNDLVAPNNFFVQLVRLSISLCVITILFFAYNSVRVLDQPIISTATCSLYWVIYFSFTALKSLLLMVLVPAGHNPHLYINLEHYGFIITTIVQLVASYVLYLALHHETEFRSSEFATIDAPPRRSCIGLGSFRKLCSWHRFVVMAITLVPLLYLVAIELAFHFKNDVLSTAVVWPFVLLLPLPRLAAMGVAVYLTFRLSSNRLLRPTVIAKVYLCLATVLSIMEDIPNSVVTMAPSHQVCKCLLGVLSIYDLLQLIGLLSFFFYLMFVRSQYLRVEQESKLNLVEGLQKLLEVNGRKDVISRDYTTL